MITEQETQCIGLELFLNGRGGDVGKRIARMTHASTFWSATGRASQALEVYLLGLVDFDSALYLQQRLVYDIAGRDDRLAGLLVCEHPPIVTVGREGSSAHLLVQSDELLARQMDVRWLNRGGGCLVHAPGQLAVYPIVPLDRLGFGLTGYRRRLEQAVIGMCGDLHVEAFRLDDQPGVACRCGQFAFLGAAVKSWVSYHGMFVNVCPDMTLMRMAQSKAPASRITSLAAQRMRATSMHAVRASLVRHLATQLGYERFHLYTGHPLLRRTKRRIHAYA